MKFTVGLCSALLLGVFIWIFQLTTVAQETSGFAEELAVSEVACTLTNGDESTCYEIESASLPEFEIGPFCPETLDDVGGIWEWDGDNAGLYALDEAFFLMVAEQGYVFYDDEGNIKHVGLLLENHHIIHASGTVRIDRIDQSGIFNVETQNHTHKLRFIKKLI